MISDKATSLLVITNAEPLAEVIVRLAQRGIGNPVRVFSLTYSGCISQLTQDLTEQTDFFVLELLRQYPGGLRAEGLTLAQRLARRGKRALIVSPLYLAKKLDCRTYWDTAASDTLVDRIQDQLTGPWSGLSELNRLTNYFAPLLVLPPQHT